MVGNLSNSSKRVKASSFSRGVIGLDMKVAMVGCAGKLWVSIVRASIRQEAQLHR